jgi:hypothetical protein
MSLPFTTTTVTVQRPANTLQDSRVEPAWTVVANGVPCVLAGVSGSELGRTQVSKNAAARFQPGTDVRSYDRLVDENTGDVFEAGMVQTRRGFGLDHVAVELHVTIGATGG